MAKANTEELMRALGIESDDELVTEFLETATALGKEHRNIGERLREHEEKTDERLDAFDAALQGREHEGFRRDGVAEQKGPFLGLEQKAAPHFGLERPDYPLDEVRVGAMIAAMAAGESVASKLNDAEKKALVESSGPAGGYLLPPVLGSMFLDAVRPRTRVLEAGAQTLPMRAPVVRIPGWDDAPSASWRGEGGAFADAGGTFRRIELAAKMVSAERELSIEMLEDTGDTNLGALSLRVEAEIGAAIAQAIDLAALMGKGSGSEPLGLYNTSGVTVTNLAAALADYDFLLDDIYNVETNDHSPSAWITSPRVKRDLAKLAEGVTGSINKATVPEDVRALRRLISNQVPENEGAGSNETLSFLGQWNRLLIGLRPDVGVRAQVDPFSKGSNGMVVVRAYARADVAILDKGAFAIHDQIL